MLKKLEKFFVALIYFTAGIALVTPLLLDNRFFFPFIATKAFVFRIAVEIAFLAFLGLMAVSKDYRPRMTRLAWFLSLFVGIAFASSLSAGNFYLSFWSDMERSEGLLLWLHLLVLFLVLSSVAREEKNWLRLFDFSLIVSWLLSLFALGQALHIKVLLASSGVRVDATLGNPAFLAAYMIFNIAFAGYLLIKRVGLPAKIYYSLSIIFFSWVVFATQTRGAAIGLLAGMILTALMLVWYYRGNAVVKKASVSAVVAIVVLAGAFYLLRQSALVQKSDILRRLTSISTEERTAQTRLATWQAAWSGWKEKFWLGWGLENFEQVFNKNFPPIIYQKEGSQVWFDRAHNLIFDRGVTTGVLGLAAYLLFIFYPLVKIFGSAKKDELHKGAAAVFAGFVLAFFIQDLFVFETITTYVVLVFMYAFFGSGVLFEDKELRLNAPSGLWLAGLIAYSAVLGPLLWKVNLYPAKINMQAAAVMREDPGSADFYKIIDGFKQVVEADTYGSDEYRVQFIEFVDQQLVSVGEVVPEVRPVLAYTDDLAVKQMKERPKDAKNFLLAMRHYNYTRASLAGGEAERLQKSLAIYPALSKLSPTRPQVEQEAGYSYLYLYKHYLASGDKAAAQSARGSAESYFNKALDLNPAVVESYVNLVMLYLNTGEDNKVSDTVNLMKKRGVNYHSQTHLMKLLNLARANQRVKWVGAFSEELIRLDPGNVDAWINLAVFYARNGEREKAIETAQKIREFGGDYAKQVDLFVQNVKAGKYEKPK